MTKIALLFFELKRPTLYKKLKLSSQNFFINLFQKLKNKFPWEYVVLSVVTLFIYQFGFQNEFTNWDNPFYLPGNRYDQPLSLENIYNIFTDFSDVLYHPLPAVIYHIFNAISPRNPEYFHIFSCFVHLLNGWLIFILCFILLKNRLKSFFIALLFVTHPMMVEAVSWVAATSTLMCTFCFLVSLIAYLNYKKKYSKRWYLFSLGMFFIGLLCKIQIAPLVVVLCAVDYLYGDYSWSSKRSLKEKLPFLILICIFYYLHRINPPETIDSVAFYGKEIQKSFEMYLIIPYQYFWYIVKLLFPYNLGVLYPFPKNLSLIHYFALAAVFPLLWVSADKKTNKILLFSIIFYSSNILIITHAAAFFRAPVSNRYAYIACLGFFIFLFHVFNKKYEKYLYIFLSILVFSNIYLSVKQVKIWKNSVTLWEENLKYGSKIDSYIMLGNHYTEQKEYEKAINHYSKVLKLKSGRIYYENYAKKLIDACKLAELQSNKKKHIENN